jgi:uncharacterized protein YegL
MSQISSNPFDTDDLGPSKPDLNVFFVIDKSGSMDGERINSVNSAMREIVDILRGIGGSDANIKIAVLTFSIGAEWMYSTPIDADQFNWKKLEVDGYTEFGAACNELCAKMSRSAFMHSKVGYKKPIVILITDGGPTDDWEKPLENLKNNRWFKFSLKFALGVVDADRDVLLKFVGSKEGVYELADSDKLKNLIKAIAITSAEIGSKSMPIDINVVGNASEEELNEQADEEVYKAVSEAVDADDWD